jgi:hypothetical protein
MGKARAIVWSFHQVRVPLTFQLADRDKFDQHEKQCKIPDDEEHSKNNGSWIQSFQPVGSQPKPTDGRGAETKKEQNQYRPCLLEEKTDSEPESRRPADQRVTESRWNSGPALPETATTPITDATRPPTINRKQSLPSAHPTHSGTSRS